MSATIKNLKDIAITPERENILSIIQAGIDAIDTEAVLRKQVTLVESTLTIKDKTYDLNTYNHVYVIGFGKASSKAAEVIDSILGDRIDEGVVISVEAAKCAHIEVIVGTHPLPSAVNVAATKKIIALADKAKVDDLVICLVSGGGSALLCGDEVECEQGTRLYNEYLKTDGEIVELNTIRKHISIVKGGGLAQFAYPATVASLIFSDIAGDNCDFITSGPTYKDSTTVADAQKIIDKYHLNSFDETGKSKSFTLVETPKNDIYFEKVSNFVIISNIEALKGMSDKATALGLRPKIVSSAIYTSAERAIEFLQTACLPGEVILAGGEIRLVVTSDFDPHFGSAPGDVEPNLRPGGRCHYLGMTILPKLRQDETFCAFATDGIDNSDSAGVILDETTKQRSSALHLDSEEFRAHFAGYTFFHKLGHEQIFTGNTESNVSDVMIIMRK